MESITGKVLRTFPRDTDPAFYANNKRTKGQIVVAAPGFGCGSYREQADTSER